MIRCIRINRILIIWNFLIGGKLVRLRVRLKVVGKIVGVLVKKEISIWMDRQLTIWREVMRGADY